MEINPDYVRYLKRRAVREKLPNITTILGQPDDSLLPPGSIDAVLLLKTYHEVSQPVALLRNLRTSLRAGGLLGTITVTAATTV